MQSDCSKPLVSVIIPCYRQAQYLREAVDSVLAQTYPSVEVIVVNDGSDDNTAEVAAEYGHQIRYIYRENGGLAAARNTGIADAAGMYLIFLDADDTLASSMIDKCMHRLKVADPGAIGVRCGHTCVNERVGSPISVTFAPDRPLTLADYTFTNAHPPHCLLVNKNAVIRAGGFDGSVTGCEDWDLWAKLLSTGLHYVTYPESLVFYRLRSDSMSLDAMRMMKAAELVLQRYAAPEILPAALANWHGQCLGIAVAQKDREQTQKFLRSAEASLNNELTVSILIVSLRSGICKYRLEYGENASRDDFFYDDFIFLLSELRQNPNICVSENCLVGIFPSVAALRERCKQLDSLVLQYQQSASYRIGRFIVRLAKVLNLSRKTGSKCQI